MRARVQEGPDGISGVAKKAGANNHGPLDLFMYSKRASPHGNGVRGKVTDRTAQREGKQETSDTL